MLLLELENFDDSEKKPKKKMENEIKKNKTKSSKDAGAS